MIPFPSASPRRIYLAGPMQGIPEFNFPLFHAVTWALRRAGHEVFCPAENDLTQQAGTTDSRTGSLAEAKAKGFSLREALADDTRYICLRANTVVILPDWEKSNGVQAEQRLAVALKSEGMHIEYLSAIDADLILIAHGAWLKEMQEQASGA